MEISMLISILITSLCRPASCLTREHFYVENHMNWSEAQKHCRQHYTDLSSIRDKEENYKFLETAAIHNSFNAWIGLYQDALATQGWSWSEGVPSKFFHWKSGKPDNYGGNEECVTLDGNHWDDFPCGISLPFFCFREYEMVLVPLKKTWEEALEHCRGLHTDLLSVASESTLIQAVDYSKKVQDDFINLINDGSFSQLLDSSSEPLTDNAYGSIQNLYNTLNGSADSLTEFVWIGLRFLGGQWLWVNRDPLEYSKWSKDENPQCPAIPFRCGALSIAEKVWNTKSCEDRLNFICYKV